MMKILLAKKIEVNDNLLVDDLEERSFPTRVTFHVSDHDDNSHGGNNIKLTEFKNSTDITKNQVSC